MPHLGGARHHPPGRRRLPHPAPQARDGRARARWCTWTHYSSATTYTDTGVEPGVLYVYRVQAVINFFGELGEASDPVEIRTPPGQQSARNSRTEAAAGRTSTPATEAAGPRQRTHPRWASGDGRTTRTRTAPGTPRTPPTGTPPVSCWTAPSHGTA